MKRGFGKFLGSTNGHQSHFSCSQSTMDPDFSTKQAADEWDLGILGKIVYYDDSIPFEIMVPHSSNTNNNNINLVNINNINNTLNDNLIDDANEESN